MSKKQKSVVEIGYISTSMISYEAAWLGKLFSELFVHIMNTTKIICNNQRWDLIIEESHIRRLLQQIDIILDIVIQ